MKICCNCRKPKELEEFNKHSRRKDGVQPECRQCQQQRAAAYAASEAGRATRKAGEAAKYSRRLVESPEKLRARYMLRNAVKTGKVIKSPCEKCGAKAEGHHDDYSKPLEVKWLCRKHHAELHREAA